MEIDAIHSTVRLSVGINQAEHLRGTGEASVVHIGDDKAARTLLGRMASDVDAAKPHRAAARQQQHRTTGLDAHLVHVRAEVVVVVCTERRDDAGDRLRERALEVGVAVVGQQAAHLHHDGRQIDVRGVAADRVPGIAHRLKLVAGDVERRLDTDMLTDAELVLPLRADLADDAADFVAEHRRTRRDVARHALVSRPQGDGLVVAQADRVRDEFDDDALVARALKLNILEPRIGGPVQSPGLRLHPIRSFDYST